MRDLVEHKVSKLPDIVFRCLDERLPDALVRDLLINYGSNIIVTDIEV